MNTLEKQHLLWLALSCPLWSSLGILVFQKRANVRDALPMIAALVQLILFFQMFPMINEGSVIQAQGPSWLNGSIEFTLDSFGLLFATLASFLWLLTSLYSVGYMRGGQYKHQTRFAFFFSICIFSTLMVALSGNMLTLFVGYEILTLSTYPLVMHQQSEAATRAGRQYLLYTLGAGQLILIAMIAFYHLFHTTSFHPGGYAFSMYSEHSVALVVIFGLFMIGFGVKAALFPLHSWLPSAMIAPTPVSALLHAVAVVKSGVFALCRVIGFLYGIETMKALHLDLVLGFLAAFTILFASTRALGETQMKKILAYSTISQLSYILLGMAIGTTAAVLGAIFHMVAHAFMKITLFFGAGSIQIQTGKTDIEQMEGLGKNLPITFVCFSVGCLSMIGIPLFVGFVSKWQLITGSLRPVHGGWVWVWIASTLLNIAYFFPIIYKAFFHARPSGDFFKEGSWSLWLPIGISTLMVIVLGIQPDFLFSFYQLALLTTGAIVP
ncbi:MAG: proton-conducting transporter membrane subunit [Bdellovibrionota bacterium]